MMTTETYQVPQLPGVTVIHGDCIEAMRDMPAESVDSIVCDPPYGLGFMGKAWDQLPPGLPWAQECLRVLKPGGHLLAFGGTRTWHRLAVAVEDAGFEIRDSIAWLYGSGFPKSLDVSKAIDKARTEDKEPTRVVCRTVRASMEAQGLKSRDLVQHFSNCDPRLIDHWAARDTDSQPSLPTWEQWETLTGIFPELVSFDSEVWRLNSRKGSAGEAWQTAAVVGIKERAMSGWSMDGATKFVDREEKAANSPEAEQWQGWGTAMKPAFEPVVVGRKPFKGNVAQNVLTHGTGALNIDGCRIEASDPAAYAAKGASVVGLDSNRNGAAYGEWTGKRTDSTSTAGRWPANVILDEEMAQRLDEQSGPSTSPSKPVKQGGRKSVGGILNAIGDERDGEGVGYGDSGGASRFFLNVEADEQPQPDRPSANELNDIIAEHRDHTEAGCVNRPLSSYDPSRCLPYRLAVDLLAEIDLTQQESEADSRFFYCAKAPKKERPVVDGVAHPTVKPLALMRWLVRLVTPPGGIVLDPFAGSGTTVEAALLEGFRVVGIELAEEHPEYMLMIQQRILRALGY